MTPRKNGIDVAAALDFAVGVALGVVDDTATLGIVDGLGVTVTVTTTISDEEVLVDGSGVTVTVTTTRSDEEAALVELALALAVDEAA